MAIQVGGTTVIDNSRNLQNVGGLKTINSTSILGSGNIEAGASTTQGAVGTYAYGRPQDANRYALNSTSSAVKTFGWSGTNPPRYITNQFYAASNITTLSGTWRCMSEAYGASGVSWAGIWVRIS